MGLGNGNRGSNRGVNGAADRSEKANQAANADYAATGRINSPAQRAATKAADDLATIRRNRQRRGA
jgi:hypothetical protein